MKRLSFLIALLVTFLVGACVNPTSNKLAANDDDEFGIGGTGMQASGPVGLLGQVTGFGSIFVNGIEVEPQAATALSIDGRPVASIDFELGDVVEVLTRDDAGYTDALRVNLRHEVIGPLDTVSADGRELRVLGQVVRLHEAAASFAVGDRLAVAGFRDQAGMIHASRVTRIESTDVLLRGELERGPGGATVAGQSVQMAGQATVRGGRVVAHGRLVGETLQITDLSAERLLPFAEARQWRIEGFAALYGAQAETGAGIMPTVFNVRQLDSGGYELSPLSRETLRRGVSMREVWRDKGYSRPGGSGGARTNRPGQGRLRGR
jgi:hypothetical protein